MDYETIYSIIIVAILIYIFFTLYFRNANKGLAKYDSETKREVASEEQKTVITKKHLEIKYNTQLYVILIGIEAVLTLIIFKEINFIGMCIVVITLILLIIDVIKTNEAKKVFSNNEYTISIKKLEKKKYYDLRGFSTEYYYYFEGLHKRHKARYKDFRNSRPGDEFYIIAIGNRTFCYNTLHYKLSEEEKTKLVS